jgi:hypothetical protein
VHYVNKSSWTKKKLWEAAGSHENIIASRYVMGTRLAYLLNNVHSFQASNGYATKFMFHCNVMTTNKSCITTLNGHEDQCGIKLAVKAFWSVINFHNIFHLSRGSSVDRANLLRTGRSVAPIQNVHIVSRAYISSYLTNGIPSRGKAARASL